MHLKIGGLFMNTYYNTANGTRLEVFMWGEFFDNNDWRKTADVTPIYNGKRGKECKKNLHKDEHGLYIMWDKQKIYLNDFHYDSASVMARKIEECVEKKDRWLVSDDEITATFMKDTKNIGLIIDMPVYDMVMKNLGFGIVGDNECTTLCIPTEKQYNKNQWYYKFTAECDCVKLREIIPSRNFYMSDFCSLLKSGHVKMVDKNEYIAEMKKKEIAKTEESKKFVNRVKKFFGLFEVEAPEVIISL
jgi:hypothetical protein